MRHKVVRCSLLIANISAMLLLMQGTWGSSDPYKRFYIVPETDEVVEYRIPFKIRGVEWRSDEEGTQVTIHTTGTTSVPSDAVFILQVKLRKHVIAFAQNYDYPGLSPNTVGLVTYYGAELLTEGTITFSPETITLRVPIQIPAEDAECVMYYYLPTVEDRERAGGPKVADWFWINRNLRGVLPGFPIQAIHSLEEQQ